jgi:hypothetical protein
MKKVTYFAGLAGMVPLAAGFIAPAAAHAAQAGSTEPQALPAGKTVSLHNVRARPAVVNTVYSCFPAGTHKDCWAPIIHGPAPFFSHNGAFLFSLHNGNSVFVTCHYGNPIQDHVTLISRNGTITSANGHVSDFYVNFSNQNPSRVGIGPC